MKGVSCCLLSYLLAVHCAGVHAQSLGNRANAPTGTTLLTRVTTKATSDSQPYALAVRSGSPAPVAGKPVNLVLLLPQHTFGTDQLDGTILPDRLAHLVVVRDDLSSFYYGRPPVLPDGSCATTFNFPTSGKWRLFADAPIDGHAPQMQPVTIKVDGPPTMRETLRPVVQPRVSEEGVTLALQNRDIPANKDVTLTFTLTDSAAQPIADLQSLDGGWANLILIEQDATTLVVARVDGREPRQGTLPFTVQLPKPGIYKGWVQFQRGGETKTLSFVIRTTN